MNILTGIVFCVLAISLVCVYGSNASDRAYNVYCSAAAVALLCMIALGGHWIAVLLGML